MQRGLPAKKTETACLSSGQCVWREHLRLTDRCWALQHWRTVYSNKQQIARLHVHCISDLQFTYEVHGHRRDGPALTLLHSMLRWTIALTVASNW